MTALVEGFDAVELGASGGALQATFVPGAGMVCCSLRHRGRELLAQRHGVRAYAERGSTMGIPLLYPWANRLAGFDYATEHGRVALARENPLLTLDEHGLPIHGVLAGALPWELLEGEHGGDRLHARLRWRRAELLAIFPYEHELELRASVTDSRLQIETTVRAGAHESVPVSFGFHPYFTLPDADRSACEVELPVRRRLLLDERMIPTGDSEPFDRRRFALADSSWDDAFAELVEPPVFRLAGGTGSSSSSGGGGARTIAVELLRGYSCAQLYSPADASFACFEPMTAPANALRSGRGLQVVAPAGEFEAAFSIAVGD